MRAGSKKKPRRGPGLRLDERPYLGFSAIAMAARQSDAQRKAPTLMGRRGEVRDYNALLADAAANSKSISIFAPLAVPSRHHLAHKEKPRKRDIRT